MVEASTYLELRVGAFFLALRTGCVRSVAQEVEVTSPGQAELRPGESGLTEPPPVIRLGRRGELAAAGRYPFVVTVDTPGGAVSLVADQVGYLTGVSATRLAIPRFGLQRPELFEGAVRHDDRLRLLLAPPALARLASELTGPAAGGEPRREEI